MAMNQARPVVSIVIPFYNAEQYLSATVESILDQSLQDFEILLVDDGSTDDSERKVRPYLSDRVRYHRQPVNAGGPASPRNAGIRLAQGKYIALFDADDLMLPGKLAESVRCLEKNADAGLLCTNFKLVDAGEQVLSSDFLGSYREFRTHLRALGNDCYKLEREDAYFALLAANFIGTSSVVIPRKVLEIVGGFDETLLNADDYDLWLRIVRKFDLIYVDRVYHAYRIVEGGISSRGLRNERSRIRVLEKQLSVPMSPKCFNRARSRLRAKYQEYGDACRRHGDVASARTMLRKSLALGISWRAVKGFAATYLKSWGGAATSTKM